MAALSAREGVAARALAFTILTAARSGETRGMNWGEVDLEMKVWIIPAERMKAGREHRVPLTDAALALIGQRATNTPDDALIFGSEAKPGKPISDMSMTAVLCRMERNDITVHGFRSTFRDWAGENTGFPREVIEAALAHGIKDKAEAAYARSDLFEKRRAVMGAWSIVATKPDANENVIAFSYGQGFGNGVASVKRLCAIKLSHQGGSIGSASRAAGSVTGKARHLRRT